MTFVALPVFAKGLIRIPEHIPLFLTGILAVLLFIWTGYKYRPALSAILSIAAIALFAAAIFLYSSPSLLAIKGGNQSASAINGAGSAAGNPGLIEIAESVMIDAPVVNQMPELPRGCEVTTLAMLLGSAGAETDKMALAEEIRKDPSERKVINGQVHYGNPHSGFVGSIYTYNEPGLGVYNEPIAELAEAYLPGRIVNMTGRDFEELKIPLSDGRPVWVIINTAYEKLDDSYFETWQTESGPIRITRKEHSVLVTGYDTQFIYFNDPLTGEKNKKAPIGDFAAAWVQMGSQALTFTN